MRGVFATGVLDRFLELGFDPFDLFMGVSSGAGNIAAFMAGMSKRNLKIYIRYSLHPEFISIKKFIKGGHLMDLDWMWDRTIKEIRLDLTTIYQSKRPFIVCLTDVNSGQPFYKRTNAKNLEAVLKASSALPVLYRGFPQIDARPFTDGGIAAPLPVKKAVDLGGRKIMVLRSRPRFYRKKETATQLLLRVALAGCPALAKTAAERVEAYNGAIEFMQSSQQEATFIEVCPPGHIKLSRFCRSRTKMLEAYLEGKKAGDKAMKAWCREETEQ